MSIPVLCYRIARVACAALLTVVTCDHALGQAKPTDATTYEQNVHNAEVLNAIQNRNTYNSDDVIRKSAEQQRWQTEQDAMRRAEIAASGLLIFPPFPPALAASIKAKDGPIYPEILADCSGEPFFMPYGSLRLRNLLSPRWLQRIEKYRADRGKLLGELRETVAKDKHETAAVQLETLSRLAPIQDKRLLALEEEGENIRVALTTGAVLEAPGAGFLGTSTLTEPFDAGTALINAREKVKAGEQPGLKNYLTAILAAQFEPGLSPDQRLMLQEIAADSLVTAQTASKAELHFFLPGSARVRWPEKPDGVLAKKLELFQEKRTVLKRELTEAVIGVSDEHPDSNHTKKYADLAKAQAPRFAELEVLAEEIRVALAGLPYPDQPAPSSLPADLTKHVGHMMDDKTALLREVQRAATELGRELAPERVEAVYQNNTASLAALPAIDPAASPKKNRKALLARLQARNDEFKKRFVELAAEMNSVRTEIQRYHDALPGEKAPDVNALSLQLARAYTLQENWNRYRDYRDAALTPGLSPAQRRLLFAAAVVDLEKYRLSLAN